MEKRNGNLSGMLHLATMTTALVGIIIGALAYSKDGQDLTKLNELDARVKKLEPELEPVLPSKWTVENPDPTLFKWNGPVNPGVTACGFLTVPLSYAPQHLEKPFPEVPRAKKGMPRTQVYLCMKFATETLPAKRGTVFVHCGGPNTMSNCAISQLHSKDVQNQYNFLTVDQRGMGKSALKRNTTEPDILTGLDFGLCSSYWQAAEGATFGSPGYSSVSFASGPPGSGPFNVPESWFDKYAKATNDCWNLAQFNIKNPSVREDARAWTSLHFLRNSGTQALINDLNVFRHAIGAEKLSFHGGSYGTAVAGAFATTFPGFVDKLILNSPVPPIQDANAFAVGKGSGTQAVQDYKLYVGQKTSVADSQALAPFFASLKNVQMPTKDDFAAYFAAKTASPDCAEACEADYGRWGQQLPSLEAEGVKTLQSLRELLSLAGKNMTDPQVIEVVASVNRQVEVYAAAELAGQTRPVPDTIFSTKVQYNGEDYNARVQCTEDYLKVLQAAGQKSKESEFEAAAKFCVYNMEKAYLIDRIYEILAQRRLKPDAEFFNTVTGTACVPTGAEWPDCDSCADGDNRQKCQTQALSETAYQWLVDPQDKANHDYTTATAFKNYERAKTRWWYPPAAGLYLYIAAMFYAWPPSAPLPPMGNPSLGGIVVGNLFDPNTHYSWAQQMKAQFLNTALITTPMVSHVLTAAGGNARYTQGVGTTVCFSYLDDYLLGNGQPEDGTYCPVPEPPQNDRLKDIIDYESKGPM